MEPFARTFVIAGLVLVALGVLLHAGPSLPWLGRLPGDLRIERGGFRLYLPLTSCVLVSLAISFAMWLVARLR